MIDFKRLLTVIAIGGLGALVFIGVNFIGDNDDRLVTGNLVSKLSPTPLVTEKVVTQTEGVRKTVIGDNGDKKVTPTPKVTPRATQSPMPRKTVLPTPRVTPTPTPVPTKKPTPAPTPTPTPEITPTPTLAPTATPTPEITPTPTPEIMPTPTPEPVISPNVDIVINEIAWMGTEASTYDEWTELHNPSDSYVDLEGWILVSQDDSPNIPLSGIIPANGYFLLERTDDTTVSDITADIIYKGNLSNNCEVLGLYNGAGELVDSVGCFED